MTSPKSDKRNIVCRCPKCGKDHERYVYWTGEENIKPWKRCEQCNTSDTVDLSVNQSESIPLLLETFGV